MDLFRSSGSESDVSLQRRISPASYKRRFKESFSFRARFSPSVLEPKYATKMHRHSGQAGDS
jgi:hypothetical protein